MTTQYTPTLKLALPVTGELSGTWGDVVNDNITSMIEQAIAGLSTINTWTANAHTLTTANGTTSESRCAMLVAATGGGAPTAVAEIICPAAAKLYVLQNNTSYAVTLKTSAGTGVAVAAGDTAFLFCDGTNVNSCVTTIVDGNITGNLTVGGNATINGNTTLGNATSDTITATARFASDLVPSTDNARDLGSAANSWRSLWIDGTATMALVAISGGTIDGVSIGSTTAATIINVDNLRLDGNTISSTDTNGNVVIAPNGTGDVQLDADTVRVGDSGAAVSVTSNGAGALTVTTGGAADLTLSTNSGTDSGTVVIANGVNGNITLTPNGTGDVILSADRVQIGDSNTDTTLTTNGTGSLNLTTNNGTNSGTIQIAQGANGNITLTPNGTGSVSISKLYSSGNTTLGATSANTLSVAATITSNLIFTDNTYDIGASGATRPRNLYLAGDATIGGSIAATTLDLTNLEVTNIKAKDGTAAMTIADSTGAVTVSSAFSTQGNTTLGNAAADNVTVTGTVTSNLIFTDNTYDIGASGATRPRTGYFGTSINAQSGENAYGVWIGPTTGAWSVGGYTGIAFLIRNTGGGGVGGDQGGAYIQGYQPTSGNTGGLKFITRSDASTTTTRYTIDDTGVGTWSVGSNATSMSLTATGLGLNQAAGNGTLTILKSSTYSTESSAAICLNSVNTNGYTSLQIGVDDAINSAYIQSVAKGTSYTTKFLLLNPNGGNVGIGNVTTPGNLLTVAKTGAAATVQIIANTASQNAQVVLTSTVASWYVGQNITEASTGSLEFYNGTKQMSIASTGAAYLYAQGSAAYGTLNLQSADPFLRFSDVGGTANKSKWDVRVFATGTASYENTMEFRTINDANSTFRTMAQLSYDGMFVLNPNQTNNGSLMRVYGGGTSQRGAYYSGDGSFTGGSTNYWEFGRDNSTTGDFTFAFNTDVRWRMSAQGNWYQTISSDGTFLQLKGSYTGNPEIAAIGQSSSDGFIRVKDAAGNTTNLIGYVSGTSTIASALSVGVSGASLTNAKFLVSGNTTLGDYTSKGGFTFVKPLNVDYSSNNGPTSFNINLSATSAGEYYVKIYFVGLNPYSDTGYTTYVAEITGYLATGLATLIAASETPNNSYSFGTPTYSANTITIPVTSNGNTNYRYSVSAMVVSAGAGDRPWAFSIT